ADRNRSHWSTSKTPSYTKSVSWQHHHVSDVLVEITMFDDPDWPFSESILVITTASPEEVQSWFVEEIAPDECWEGWSEDTEHGWVEVPVGMHPVTCWWD
ncbi:hypothetical protein, partial [Escherichia coli]|uniref:hypothetical protein n=2 Tax=Escherichia coli TaxID=562 RepID=UPI001F496E1A